MVEMSMIEALEKLAHLNEEGFETFVKTNAGEPQTIEYSIEDIRNYAEDPDEIFDLRVTEDTIRGYDGRVDISNARKLFIELKKSNFLFPFLFVPQILA